MSETSAKQTAPSAGEWDNAHVEELPVLIQGPDRRSLLRRFREAACEVSGPVSITALIGISIVAVAELWVTEAYHIDSIVAHVGTAFIVSGIVVFGFELGSKESWLKTMIVMLVGLLSHHQKTILDASAKDAIRNSMRRLTGRSGDKFAKQFEDLAVALADLSGTWASEAYITFIAAFHQTLTLKTQQLAKLRGEPAATSAHVHMSDATHLADILVTTTYRILAGMSDGEYWAVSDLATWHDLTEYNKAHHSLAPSLKTKRLFVLGLGSDRHLPAADVNSIIMDHWKLTNVENSKYEMKITTIAEYRLVRLIELRQAENFGIFKPSPDHYGGAIAFLVRDEGLSDFGLMEAREAMLAEFEQLWNDVEELTDFGTVSINDYVMAYLVDRMAKNSHYRGVSFLANWVNDEYEKLFRASKVAVEKKNMTMQRIIVLTNEERTSSETAKELRRHYQLRMISQTRYDFRVAIHEPKGTDSDAAVVPSEVTVEMPFALLENDEGDADEVVRELAQPEKQFAPVSAAKRARISDAFDELWEMCKGCEESLEVLVPDLRSEIISGAGERSAR